LLDLWTGFFDLGFASTAGNAETSTFTLGANASRTTPRDKMSVFFNSIRANGFDQANQRTIRTANATRGGLQYDLNVSRKLFGFGLTTVEYDRFQNLDLRFVGGGGLGYKAIRTDATTLSFNAGGSANREFFSTGLRRTSGELLLGNDFTHKFNDRLSMFEKLQFFPNLTETGQFRLNFDIGAAAKLAKWLSWQTQFGNRYLSNPVPGRKTNDTLFTTGLRVTFAR
jgi:putative salt-induced outer membrane protein YdiY